MARDAEYLRPLSCREITALLQPLSGDAFIVTAQSLYGWCRPGDVLSALEKICGPMPIPTCLHGRPWNNCIACPSDRQRAAPN